MGIFGKQKFEVIENGTKSILPDRIGHRISFRRKTQSVYIQTDLPVCFTS